MAKEVISCRVEPILKQLVEEQARGLDMKIGDLVRMILETEFADQLPPNYIRGVRIGAEELDIRMAIQIIKTFDREVGDSCPYCERNNGDELGKHTTRCPVGRFLKSTKGT